MITRKNKKKLTWHQGVTWFFVFLLTGSFLFGKNALAVGDYNKADGSRLDPAEWNGLVTDFVNTWQTATMEGPLGIGTTDPNGYKLNVNGNTNISGTINASSFLGTLNAANISSGVFGDNIGGGDYTFPGRLGIGSSPQYVLDVNVGSDDARFVGNGGGGLGFLLEETAPGGHGWYFNTNPSDGGFGINHAGIGGSISLPGERVLTALPSGNVGIGINDPGAYRLFVNGDTNISGTFNVDGSTNIGGTLNVTGLITGGGLIGIVSAANVSSGTFAESTGGGNFTFPASVSINTSDTSLATLQVGGSIFATGQDDTFIALDDQSTPRFGMVKKAGYSGMFAHSGNSDFVIGMTDTSTINPTGFSSLTQQFVIDTTGKVGIGTTNPGAKLDVAGGGIFRGTIPSEGSLGTPNIRFGVGPWGDTGRIVMEDNAANVGEFDVRHGAFAFYGLGDLNIWAQLSPNNFTLSKSNSTNVVLTTSSGSPSYILGNVGVGTTDPSQSLQVYGSVLVGNGSDGSGLKIRGTDGSTLRTFDVTNVGNTNSINFGAVGGGGDLRAHGQNFLFVNTSGTEYARFVSSSGNLGIGTTDPSAAKLVINAGTGMALKAYGDGVFTGTLQTQTGSDFAEEFSTTEDLEPGTVVVMGDNGYKSVHPCGKEYDTTVVGIVSNNPSIIAGRVISKHKAIIAMMGVVKVNVIDINGKISKGDRLTTSGISGYAMKADDSKPGTIIGKALEDLTKKSGEINVLVNLQ